ncbi:MAG TPA: hypothetical protein VG797_05760 [Phycisphaerales bacterium]|nr:hypothetical protein [Phycisphaerales bacterium]
MSEQSLLHAFVQEKFRRAFGEPHRTQGKDLHWGLRAHPHLALINILVNGDAIYPVIWVFDPHDPKDGVTNTLIRHEAEVDPIIRGIEQRVKTAGRRGSP